MKKIVKFLSLTLAALSIGTSLTSCGSKLNDASRGSKDKRPSIRLSVFNGGYRHAWIDLIVDEYNASHPENPYKIFVDPNTNAFNNVLSAVMAGTFGSDMFLSNAQMFKFVRGGYLEDISDVWATDPEAPDNKDSDRTIEKKMLRADEFKAAWGDGKGGVYGLPIQEAVRGFIYDHDLFLQYGLLFNENGEFISSPTETLSVGKDGKAGTYDDGQPITEDQWHAMVVKADRVYGNAFTYTGKYNVYLNDLYSAIGVQVDGEEAFRLNYFYDGTYDFGDGNGPMKITVDNGYLLTNMRGKKVALDFMDKYLAGKDSASGLSSSPYTNPKAFNLGYTHEDAQREFIYYAAAGASGRSAMLYEGDYWENEAQVRFKTLAKEGYKDYKFRTRNYRYMTLPRFEGQVVKSNAYYVSDNMYISVLKSVPEDKMAICKDFMTYMYQDKYIRNFTVETGGVMPFDVKFEEEDYAKMSPFTKNFLEIYNDRENNVFVNEWTMKCRSEYFKSGCLPSDMVNGSDIQVMQGLYYYDAAEYLRKMKNYWQYGLNQTSDTDDWSARVANYREYLTLL